MLMALVVMVMLLAHDATAAQHAPLADGATGALEFESLRFPPSADGKAWLQVPDAAGTPVATSATLRIPADDGPRPAVILFHGCGGVTEIEKAWERELARRGIATLTVDSLHGRGVREVCTGRALVSPLDFLVDAARARDLLAMHRRIDPHRIALMGFSLGGRTVLWSSYTRFHTRWPARGGTEIAAYVAFYPGVTWFKLRDEDTISDRPIRIFQGGADDWTPSAAIRRYVERLRGTGHTNVSITVYPGAYHGFDDPRTTLRPRWVAAVSNPSRCLLVEDADGRLVDSETSSTGPFPCLTRGAHIGPDARARAQAIRDVTAFLDDVFRRP